VTAPIPGVGPQLARAAAGTDPRGVLVFELLPSDLQNAEDSTAAADRQRMTALFDYVELKPRGGNMWVASTPPTGRSAYEPDTVEARDGALGAGRLRFGWLGWRRFVRDATAAERALLQHLGHELPPLLYTIVSFASPGVRNRTWPQLITSTQEV
jgi:hypothetical protein